MSHGLLLDAAAIRGREVIPRIVKVPQPIAGAEWKQVVPSGSVWWIQTLTAQLVASAVAATRSPALILSDSDAEFWRAPNAQAIIANQSLRMLWGVNLGFLNSQTLANVIHQWGTWPAIPVPGGWSIGSLTNLIDVGDQWSAVNIYALEVEETPYLVELSRDVAGIYSGRVDAIPQLAGAS